MVGLDDTIRAEGQPLGRFRWVENVHPSNGEGDWVPNPAGTHDGYIWRLGFYCLKIVTGPAAKELRPGRGGAGHADPVESPEGLRVPLLPSGDSR